MKFHSVDIFELVTDDDYAIVAQLKDMRVMCVSGNADAHDRDGKVVARIEGSWEEAEAVTIGDDHIKIQGHLVTHRLTKNGFGYWVCRP